MTVFYKLGNKLYVNITNKCSCNCTFCIRRSTDSVGDADSLWLEHEPSLEEIKAAFADCDLTGLTEIVFCGYGEPTERADEAVQVAEYIGGKTSLPLRLNTNGLVKLTNPDFPLSKLEVFDAVSVSLNADNAADYQKFTQSRFGEGSFGAMLSFAEEIKPYTNVFFTVVAVDGIDTEKCENLSRKAGIPLRIRTPW